MYFYIVLVRVRGYNCGYFFCNGIGICFYMNIYKFIIVDYCVIFIDFICSIFIVDEMFCIGCYFLIVDEG